MIPLDQGDWGGIAVEFVLSRTVRDQRRFLEILADGTFNPQRGTLRIGLTTRHWGGGELGPGIVDGLERVGRASTMRAMSSSRSIRPSNSIS